MYFVTFHILFADEAKKCRPKQLPKSEVSWCPSFNRVDDGFYSYSTTRYIVEVIFLEEIRISSKKLLYRRKLSALLK